MECGRFMKIVKRKVLEELKIPKIFTLTTDRILTSKSMED
jgi:hypothetical protein